MGRRATPGAGVQAWGDGIQIRFTWRGKELRPTLRLKPTAANLKHATRLRQDILDEIKAGTFDLRRYFPDYAHADRHQPPAEQTTFNAVADAFLKWVRTRQAHSSVVSLERKIGSFWRPTFGERDIKTITVKELSKHIADREWGSPKTHNNYVSALREMFVYAHDYEYVESNPTEKLKMLPVQRPDPDPYTIDEANALINAARKTHGEIDACYWHTAFLLGMRPGEQIALMWLDDSRLTGRITVQRMRTEGKAKASTKTYVARHVDVPPAARAVFNALRPLTSMRGHGFVFEDYLTGEQIASSTVMRDRWELLHKVAGVRYREPYQCRHSSVSWKLMAGENFLKVAKNHGHSAATMLKVYAHWIDTDSEAAEVAKIRTFHGYDTPAGAAKSA